MKKNRDKYMAYIKGLLKKGVCPENLLGDIIRLCTEDDEKGTYDFDLSKIIAGPDGEIIKIDEEKDSVEIYYSLIENTYCIKAFCLSTGESYSDSTMWFKTSVDASTDLYGEDVYKLLTDYVGGDFGAYYREVEKDNYELDENVLVLRTNSLRDYLYKIKSELLIIMKKNCRKKDPINDGIIELIRYVEEAKNAHCEIKQFKTKELQDDMLEIINRKLKVDGLRRESQLQSKISIIPITNIIEEYDAYGTPKTRKMVIRFTKISVKVAKVLQDFELRKIELASLLMDSKKKKRMDSKHRAMKLQRKKELEEPSDFGGFNGNL